MGTSFLEDPATTNPAQLEWLITVVHSSASRLNTAFVWANVIISYNTLKHIDIQIIFNTMAKL